MSEANRVLPDDAASTWIGVHVGSVIVDGEDLQGDAVNLDVRVQEASAAVHSRIRQFGFTRASATCGDR